MFFYSNIYCRTHDEERFVHGICSVAASTAWPGASLRSGRGPGAMVQPGRGSGKLAAIAGNAEQSEVANTPDLATRQHGQQPLRV